MTAHDHAHDEKKIIAAYQKSIRDLETAERAYNADKKSQDAKATLYCCRAVHRESKALYDSIRSSVKEKLTAESTQRLKEYEQTEKERAQKATTAEKLSSIKTKLKDAYAEVKRLRTERTQLKAKLSENIKNRRALQRSVIPKLREAKKALKENAK